MKIHILMALSLLLVSAGAATIEVETARIGNQTYISLDGAGFAICNPKCNVTYATNITSLSNLTAEADNIQYLENVLLAKQTNQTVLLNELKAYNTGNQSVMLQRIRDTILHTMVNESSLSQNLGAIIAVETQSAQDKIIIALKNDIAPAKEALDSCNSAKTTCENDKTVLTLKEQNARSDADTMSMILVVMMVIMFVSLILIIMTRNGGEIPLPDKLKKTLDKGR